MNKGQARTGTHDYYKGTSMLVFYDMNDQFILYIFDNAREIVKFLDKPVTRRNVNNVVVSIMRALKRDNHVTRIINKTKMKVYLVDMTDDSTEETETL